MIKYNPIEITLDLREYKETLMGSKDFLQLWKNLNPSFIGKKLSDGQNIKLKARDKGVIGITVITIPKKHAIITENTPFAIYSVLEKSTKKYKCYVCNDYAPFACVEDKTKRMCPIHVTILDGSMRSYSKGNIPKCKESNQPATFWCDGPQCRQKIAWSEGYKTKHPANPDYNYCKSCYDIKFPKCSHNQCQDMGVIKCEYTNPTTKHSCNNPVCNQHTKRWQVYGPERRGLELCPTHRNIKQLSDEEIIYQIIAGTERRNGRTPYHNRMNKGARKETFPFPSLQSFKHIFLNTRKTAYRLSHINQKIENLSLGLSNDKFEREMKRTIEGSKGKRMANIKRGESEKEKGKVYFEKLRQLISYERSSKMRQLANLIQFSDFKPPRQSNSSTNEGILFVKLDSNYRGFFIGRGGQTKRKFEDALNIQIRLERD